MGRKLGGIGLWPAGGRRSGGGSWLINDQSALAEPVFALSVSFYGVSVDLTDESEDTRSCPTT